jgi:hypothetical protein
MAMVASDPSIGRVAGQGLDHSPRRPAGRAGHLPAVVGAMDRRKPISCLDHDQEIIRCDNRSISSEKIIFELLDGRVRHDCPFIAMMPPRNMVKTSVKTSQSKSKERCRRGRPCDQERRDMRCEEILDKATEVFAEHGYRNTDVQYIADPLVIGKATIYRYFPTKEQLFLAAVERGVSLLNETIGRAVDRVNDPIAKMTAAIRNYLKTP